MNIASYDLDVVWSPGTTMHLADQLSRSLDTTNYQEETTHQDKILNEIDIEEVYKPHDIAATP